MSEKYVNDSNHSLMRCYNNDLTCAPNTHTHTFSNTLLHLCHLLTRLTLSLQMFFNIEVSL